MTEDLTRLLSPSQAANQLGCSGGRIRQMVANGDLPAHKTALGMLLPPEAVARVAAERAAQKSAAAGEA